LSTARAYDGSTIACPLGTPVRPLVYSVRDRIRESIAVDCLRPSPRSEEWRPRPVFKARMVSRGAWRVLACTSTRMGTGIEAPAFPRRKGNLCACVPASDRRRSGGTDPAQRVASRTQGGSTGRALALSLPPRPAARQTSGRCPRPRRSCPGSSARGFAAASVDKPGTV